MDNTLHLRRLHGGQRLDLKLVKPHGGQYFWFSNYSTAGRTVLALSTDETTRLTMLSFGSILMRVNPHTSDAVFVSVSSSVFPISSHMLESALSTHWSVWLLSHLTLWIVLSLTFFVCILNLCAIPRRMVILLTYLRVYYLCMLPHIWDVVFVYVSVFISSHLAC